MSLTPDTQPKSPFADQPVRMITPDLPPIDLEGGTWVDPNAPSRGGGPGCAVMGCVGVVGVGLSVLIVVLAAAAGWTSGRRIADTSTTATAGAVIVEQANRIPADLDGCNLVLAAVRLNYLAQLAPGDATALAPSATAAAVRCQPTATPTAPLVPTLTPIPSAEATDDAPPVQLADEDSGYDLPALLAEAAADVEAGRFEDAYELLDVIAAIDPSFEAARVAQLTGTALNGQARLLFNSSQPAQAIIWASRAEALGILQGDLSFELYAAQNYLDAKAAIGLNYPQAIGALTEIVNLGQGRYYNEALSLLVQQYVGYGDALLNDPNAGACPAVSQYAAAASLTNDPLAAQKRASAEQTCAQATPVGAPPTTPGTPLPPGAPPPNGLVAPVGQQ